MGLSQYKSENKTAQTVKVRIQTVLCFYGIYLSNSLIISQIKRHSKRITGISRHSVFNLRHEKNTRMKTLNTETLKSLFLLKKKKKPTGPGLHLASTRDRAVVTHGDAGTSRVCAHRWGRWSAGNQTNNLLMMSDTLGSENHTLHTLCSYCFNTCCVQLSSRRVRNEKQINVINHCPISLWGDASPILTSVKRFGDFN